MGSSHIAEHSTICVIPCGQHGQLTHSWALCHLCDSIRATWAAHTQLSTLPFVWFHTDNMGSSHTAEHSTICVIPYGQHGQLTHSWALCHLCDSISTFVTCFMMIASQSCNKWHWIPHPCRKRINTESGYYIRFDGYWVLSHTRAILASFDGY